MSDLERNETASNQQPLVQPESPDPQTFETEKFPQKAKPVMLFANRHGLDPIFSSGAYRFFLVFVMISQLAIITYHGYMREEYSICYNMASFYIMYFAWMGYSSLGDGDHEKSTESVSGFEPVFLAFLICNIYLSYKQESNHVIQMILSIVTFVLFLVFLFAGARKVEKLLDEYKENDNAVVENDI